MAPAFKPEFAGLGFPDPARAREDGLLALGGDLSVPRLICAYSSGIFPWSAEPVTWWSPDPRGILELDRLHVPRSLAKVLRRAEFEITFDRAFIPVMEGCATSRRRGNWITPAFIEAYAALHRAGHAHSIECWQDGQLAGGVYGVHVGGLFAGESMFHTRDNASKVALVHLVHHLRDRGFVLFDLQMVTPITRRMGASWIPRHEYLQRLKPAVALPVTWI